ncbi:MAG: hypothetical protein EOO88_55915 [Pedobacter sp.]|nr:MAG: hypothetical protein EOO88_55915 [Pedobacter sp.]
MKKPYYFAAYLSFLTLVLCSFTAKSQTKGVAFDGVIVSGYVDQGAFINCIGPSVKINKKAYTVLLGLLPSMRIKADKVAAGATKNTALAPGLGFGVTAVHRHIALQLPFYYNPKTAAKNGKWHPGFGLGYKF